MLLMLLIGWTILLPAIVVGGLYVSSSVLGRRRAASTSYDDLYFGSDEASSESVIVEVTPEAITGATRQPASPDAAPRRPVGAGH